MSNCIVVLGMHRTGTSLVAGALHKMGISMGKRFRPPDSSNPHGYWEDLDWRDLNKAILSGTGGTWYSPPSLPRIEREVARLAFRVRELVAERDGTGKLWGMKDPRTALSIQYIHPLLPSPRYIITHRQLWSTMDSLARRSRLRHSSYYETPEHWRALIDLYNLRIESFLSTVSPIVHVVKFEEAIHTPEPIIRGLADFLGITDESAIASAIGSVK